MRLFRIFLCVLAFGAARAAEAPPREYAEAARFYDAGKFAEARESYEALVNKGSYSANLFYNLGDTWFRLGDPGRAILNYERALALEPSHPEARANLAFVREQTGARTAPRTWLDYVAAPFDINVLTLACAISVWAILLALVGMAVIRRRPPLWVAIAGGLVVAGIAGLGIAAFERDKSLAVVTEKQVEARLEPLDNSGLAETLPSGSEVKILSDRGPWLYCSLPDNGRGWLPSKSVGVVRLPSFNL